MPAKNEIKAKPEIKLTMLFSLLVAYVILISYIRSKHPNFVIYYLFVFALISCVLYTLWKFFGTIKIKADQNQLIITYNLFYIPFRRDVFDIHQMKVIKKLLNTKSNEPVSFSTYRIGAITYTPKSSLLYEYYPVLIQFKYINNLQIVIGKGWRAFDADTIINEIEEQQYKKIVH